MSSNDRSLLIYIAEFIALFVVEREEDDKVNGHPMAKSDLF